MNITWHGLSCFSIKTKNSNGEVSLVIDPYQNSTGLRFPRSLAAHIVLSSHNKEDANNTKAVKAVLHSQPFVIDIPGEFEVKRVFIYSINAPLANSKEAHQIFRIEIGGVKIAHLGSIDRELDDKEFEQLKDIDVLMLPVGGNRVLSAKIASDMLGKIEPRIVIPYSYQITNVKEKLGGVDEFCKELGVCKREDVSKLKITKKTLPENDMMIYVLNRD